MSERRQPENQTIRDAIDLARSQEFVTVDQLALLLQASVKTIRRRIKTGDIKGVCRTNGLLRINRVIALHYWMKPAESVRIAIPSHCP